jgi:hypothetical protein
MILGLLDLAKHGLTDRQRDYASKTDDLARSRLAQRNFWIFKVKPEDDARK